MNWYKTAQAPGYPYYLAEVREGRFKGMYPPEIAVVPSLKRQWDRGGFGMGTRSTEIEDASARSLMDKLRRMGKDPRFDDVEIYIVRAPNSPRERVQFARFFDIMTREER